MAWEGVLAWIQDPGMDIGEPSYISCEKKSLLAGFAVRTVLGLPEWGLHYILFLQLQLQVTIDSIASSSLNLRKETHAAAIVGLLGLALLKDYSWSASPFSSRMFHCWEAIEFVAW